jgi:very-short-patch-repair endonuclease
MWLFHTATLNDLSAKCIRYRLLEYCQNPKVEQTQVEGLDIDDLRLMAKTTDRDKTAPPNPFESWFEIDVFLRIHEHGYRVIPQFPIAGYFTDLMIEGMRGRVLVECDGDFWHGPERHEEDMKRQRQIERCGWKVWRVRGSSFYREPGAALENLWRLLEELGIRPDSADPNAAFSTALPN